MSISDAVEGVLLGTLRYHLYRYASDRCRYSSAASILGIGRDIQFAVDDGCDGYVLDTMTGKKIPLGDALEIVAAVVKKKFGG